MNKMKVTQRNMERSMLRMRLRDRKRIDCIRNKTRVDDVKNVSRVSIGNGSPPNAVRGRQMEYEGYQVEAQLQNKRFRQTEKTMGR